MTMSRLHQACVAHQTRDRIRLTIGLDYTVKQDDLAAIAGRLEASFCQMTVAANSVTGSLVLAAPDIDLDTVAEFARGNQLFKIVKKVPTAEKNLVINHFKRLVSTLDTTIKTISGQQLDMPSSVFLVLIVHVIREIARGNLSSPSWFTALWFASTLFTRDFKTSAGGSDTAGHTDTGYSSDDGGADG